MAYGIVMDVAAPIEFYDAMHAEIGRRAGGGVEGLLLHVARETPRSWAICSHVQPWSRALLTWRSSSRSTSVRSDRTAFSPTAGSLLLAADATCVVSVMAVNLSCAPVVCQPLLTQSTARPRVGS